MSFHPLYAYEMGHCNHEAARGLPEHAACRPCVLAWHEQAAHQRIAEARAAAFREAAAHLKTYADIASGSRKTALLFAVDEMECIAAIEEVAKQ